MSRRLSVVALLALIPWTASCVSAGPTSPTTSEGPRHGGVLNVRVDGDPADWDITYGGQTNAPAIRLVYDSVLGYKTPPDVAYNDWVLRPRLAERWEVSPDAKTYTFHLRKGVKFADIPPVNGREMTSADVKWSFEYLARGDQFMGKKLPPSQFGWNFEGMDSVETPDASTVVVRFKEPFAPFLNYTGAPTNAVMPREIYEQDGHMRDRAVGTNAFQHDPGATQKGTRWVFKKNPGYWQPGRPYIDEMRFIVLPDESAANAAFQTKQVDMLSPIRDAQVAQQIARDNPNAIQHVGQRAARIIYINNTRTPLNDVRVRKAFSFGIDRTVFSQLFGGTDWEVPGVGVASGVLPPEEVKHILRYDPGEARRLLQEAGHAQGVTLELQADNNQEGTKIFELLQAQLKSVGINLVGKLTDERAALARRGEFDINIGGNLARVDIDADLFGVFHSTALQNLGKVKDAKLDRLLEAQRREPDPQKRMEIVREAVRYINENVFASAFPRNLTIDHWHLWVKGYAPHISEASGSLGPQGLTVDAWLEK